MLRFKTLYRPAEAKVRLLVYSSFGAVFHSQAPLVRIAHLIHTGISIAHFCGFVYIKILPRILPGLFPERAGKI